MPKNRRTRNNACYKAFNQHLKSLPNSPTINTVMDYCKLADLESMLNQYFPTKEPADYTSKKGITFIRKLYMGFNFPSTEEHYEILGITKDDLFSQWSPQVDTLMKFYSLSEETKMLEYAEKYSNVFGEAIKQARDLLLIRDEMGGDKDFYGSEIRFIPRNHLKKYQFAQEATYELIIDQLKEFENLKYKRYFSLSSAKNNIDDCLNIFIAICPLSLFEHVCKCLYQFSRQSEFYIVDLLDARHSIVDDQFIINEQYGFQRISNQLIYSPISIRLEQIRDAAETRVIYEENFKKMGDLSRNHNSIRPPQLWRALQRNMKKYEEKIKLKMNLIEELESSEDYALIVTHKKHLSELQTLHGMLFEKYSMYESYTNSRG